ncbi:MAG: acetate--CoA ligase family protein [Acidilobaceae archaeon]|nr:acetate--CoA ligase family protein [Acidilobaceae archaeon]MCX8165261.1 acetate--CoA ligase family protein [Acidilobaceae archaeon]MDW7973687.1 acetate--CoA ligase family protein [Sulfolobales archaeon]
MIEVLFSPKSVAIAGASERPGSLGRGLAENVLSTFKGEVFLVNPRGGSILGRPAHKSMREVSAELSLIITPSSSVPEVLEQSGEGGARAAIVYSGGFGEAGQGELEEEVKRIARRYSMRVLGPNCVGIIDLETPLNATFMSLERQGIPERGGVSLISQSGALGSLFLDYMSERSIGLRRFASVGNAADVKVWELLEHLSLDPSTKAIGLYLESAGEGRELYEAMRRASRRKPLVVLKGGSTESGSRAAATHVAALAKQRKLVEGALRQSGAVVARSPEEFVAALEALSKVEGRMGELVAVTNTGGMGVLLSDALEEGGVKLRELPEDLARELREVLPPFMALNNPIDLSGGALAEHYERVAQKILARGYSLVLVNQPQTIAMDSENFVAFSAKLREAGAPFIVLMAGGKYAQGLARELRRRGIAVASSPQEALAMVRALRREGQEQEAEEVAGGMGAREIVEAAVREGRRFLLEHEAKRVLSSYGLRVPRGGVARSAEEARALAEGIGGPVAMKLLSPDVIHRTEVGGVKLRVEPREAARAFEEMVSRARGRGLRLEGVLVEEMVSAEVEIAMGAIRDNLFGPALFVGLGGFLVELLQNASFRLSPLSRGDVREMLREAGLGELLRGYRGSRLEEGEAARALAVLGKVMEENPEVAEIDVNPLALREGELVVLDTKIKLKAP